MNERHEHDEHSDPGTDGPDPVDARLTATGAELRDSSSAVHAERIIASVLRADVTRARRQRTLATAAAILVVVAVVGATTVGRSKGAEQAAGQFLHDGSAEAIVDDLPPEPLDPLEVELVATVSRFDSCEALLDRLHRVGAAHVGSHGFGGNPTWMNAVWRLSSEGAADAATSSVGLQSAGGGGAPGSETLGTNVIVAGVDEPDTVKATDTIVVDLHGDELRVVDSRTATLVGTLQLESSSASERRWAMPSSLLVEGRRAVVFGSEWVASDPLPDDPSQSRPTVQYLTVTFVDLTDAANPTVAERVRVEGSLVAVRRVGGEVRMVTSSSLSDLPMVLPTSPNSVAPALRQNRLAVAGSTSSDWIPDWDRGDGSAPSPLMGCGDVVVPDTFAGVQMTSMVEFDMAGAFAPRATALLAPAEDLTATATDVVIGSHVWVDPIDQRGDFSDWSTALHRFRFTDDGAPEYLASGAVDGSIRDDFSLAVLDGGVVGTVTADVLPWDRRDEAEVTVRLLRTDEAARTLDQVGSLVPVDSGQAVSGLRFLGNRLLLSTGFGGNIVSSVDLSNPAAPINSGTVDLPGTGSYFQPVDDTTVLALGQTLRKDGDEFISGLHATVLRFDGTPRIAGTWAKELLSSSATHDHHAFTWWPNRSLAAFGTEHQLRVGEWQPSQAQFLSVGAAQPTPITVTPREADLGPRCPTDRLYDPTTCDSTGQPSVQRVLVVDGAPWLYTSESLERLDPQSLTSTAIVALRP